MAMVVEAFASNLSDLLLDMAKEEASMLLGVSDEITKLNDTLSGLKKYLADAERKRITEEYAQEWVRKLKDAMYDATDITDLVQLKAEERRASMKTSSGCLNSLLFCLHEPLFAHRMGRRIKALNQKMDASQKQGAQLNFINLGPYDERKGGGASHKTAPGIVHGDVVGEKIEQDTRMLVEVLTKEEMAGGGNGGRNNVLVVAILGTGGIGKTTLAKKIFSDQTVQDSFDTKVWLSVTQDFNEVDLLRTAITAAQVEPGLNRALTGKKSLQVMDGVWTQKPWEVMLRVPAIEAGAQEKSLLEPALTRALKGKKFLLVMDDVWTQKPWEEVLRVPAIEAGAHGSRVLITTRNEGVAREMKAVHLHHVSKLQLKDAWALLEKQVALSESEIERLKQSGMKIVEKCDGLPLAIKVVGGILCKKDRTKNNWEEVLNNHIWSKMGLPEELNKAIYLSYEDLAPNLKQCFVYYSLFPKDEVIGLEKVVSMWTAEGFLGNDGNSRQLGVEYYKELIMRNLLEPDDYYYNQEHCIMHDVIRSFAHYVARDEALVVGDTQNIANLTSSKYRRLSILANEIEWSDLQKQRSLRTLLLFGNIKFKHGDSLGTLPCLRTIHVRNANFATLVDSLCHLKHLRYLELRYTDISSLPKNIGRMKFLEHIGLRGCRSLSKLPSSIVKLEKLRYLSIDETNIDAIPKGFSRLENLELLWGFPVHIITDGTAKHSCSLEELGPLSRLWKLKLKGLENVPCSSMATLANLGIKEYLTCLELWCTSRLTTNGDVNDTNIAVEREQINKEVFDELRPPPCLEELTIGGYFGHILPGWITMPAATFLQNLRRLELQDLPCCIHLPAGLGQLPDLDCLIVNDAPCIERIGHEFFHGEVQRNIENKSTNPAFPKLHELFLEGMREWKEWTWEEHVEAMPVLSVLLVRNCMWSHLPPGLPCQARALKRLAITDVKQLYSVENFNSVVKLDLYDNPDLGRIINLPKMQNLTVIRCPKLMLLEGVAALQSIQLRDHQMETLPGYLQHIKLRQLEFVCSIKLLRLISMKAFPEWEKIRHITDVKGFSSETDEGWRWYVSYTRDPCTFDTNIENQDAMK